MDNGEDTFEAEEDFVDELKPGTRLMLGQYTIERFLAAGGFGITYLATDSLERRLVIKECFPGNFCRRQNHSVLPRSRAHQDELKSIVRLFSQEALTLSKADHPNIVGVHQVFEENNTAYMALDFVDGRDLLEILNEDPGSLTPAQIQQYLLKMLDAIGLVHRKGLLHRDISPDNIIISTNDEPVLIDFGAARENADEKASRLLSALRVVKDGYSPQEFYIAGSEQSASCDLYSLAASFYHIITGELPPDSQSRLTAFAAGEPDPYVPLAKRSKDYSKSFASALDKAMSILPKDRMQSAEDWLAHIENGPRSVAGSPRGAGGAKPDSKQKSSMMPLLLGGTALAAAAGVGVFYFATQPSDTFEATTEDLQTANVAPEITPPMAPSETPDKEEVVSAEPESEGGEASETSDFVELFMSPEAPETLEAPAADDVAAAPGPVVEESVSREIAVLDDAPANAIEPVPDTEAPEPRLADAGTTSEEAAEVSSGADLTDEAQQPVASVAEATPLQDEEERVAEASDRSMNDIVVNSTWSVRLPFEHAPDDMAEVGDVLLDGWSWLKPGTRIISVNGMEIGGIPAIQAILRQSTVLTDQSQLDVMLGVGRGADGQLEEYSIILPVVEHTALGNGVQFEGRFRNGVWQTVVTKVPDASVTTLEVGDLLVEYLPTNELIDDRTSLRDAIQSDRRKGMTECPVLVSRDSAIVEATIDFAPEPLSIAGGDVAETSLPASSVLPSTTANADIGSVGAASVMLVDVASIPFTLSPDEPGVVETVAGAAPFWLTQGVRIVSVDGVSTSGNGEILNLIRQAVRTAGGEATVTIGTDARLSSAAIERRLTIGSERQTALLNGLVFVAREEDGAMVTRVVQAPEESSFQVGDKVVAFMATGETIDGSTTLKAILDRELAAGQTNFSFAVEREGEMWVEAFNLAALAE